MRLIFLLVFAAALSAAPSRAADLDAHFPPDTSDVFLRSMISSAASTAFSNEDFAAIDSTAKKYLRQHAKTPAGVWKLGLIYDGFSIDSTTDEYLYTRDEKLSEKWIKKFPASPVARIVYANQLIAHAYFFRGNGLAGSVPASSWPKFRSYIDRARDVLQGCKSICSVDPNWYVAMLSVANLQDWDKKNFATLFNEASRNFPNYQKIYFVGANYYSPLWHGSTDALDEFVQDAAGKTRESEGTTFYARIYGYILHSSGFACECSRIAWPRMFNALNEINERYPDAWNVNEFAWEACMAGDKIAFRDQIKKVTGGPPYFEIWGSQDILNVCKTWAADKFTPPGVSPFARTKPSKKETTTL